MPALWSHNTGQGARLASQFEPWSDTDPVHGTRSLQEECKLYKKDKSGRDTPRLEHRGRTRENASDPDSRSVCCSQKAPERQHHDLYSGFKKKTPSTCYPNNHDVKVPPARQTIDVRPLNLTHTPQTTQ